MNKRSILFLAVAVLAAPPAAMAAWPNSPDSALVITDAPGEQVQPKIVKLLDDGYYVSWFDGFNGYDVRLQRFDKYGNALWGADGILVADRDFGSTNDYGLDRDGQGNAVLAYRLHDAAGIAQVAVSKIRRDGTPMWQNVIVSDTTSDNLAPYVAATSDGGTVSGWLDPDGKLVLQKLDRTGQPLWGSGRELTPPAGAFFLPADLQASGRDVIYQFQAQGQSIGRQLWMQKLGADGQPLWSDYTKLWDSNTGSMPLGYFPKFKSDGAGGAVACWQYGLGVGNDIRAQHVLSDGSELYPHNGVALSNDTSRSRVGVDCSYDRVTGAIYAVWMELSQAPGEHGIYAQRVDANGVPGWGGSGLAVVPVAANEGFSELIALPVRDGFIASWTQDSILQLEEPLYATAIDSDGQPGWDAGIVKYKDFDSQVGRVQGISSYNPARVTSREEVVFVWQNSPPQVDSEDDLMMQKLNPEGGIGSLRRLR